MINVILIGLGLAIVLLLLFATTRPDKFHIERSITIAATPAAIFPELNDLRRVQAWSPWKDKDPNAAYTFSGPADGVGAAQAWTGNREVGAGRQTIIESNPGRNVRVRIDFAKPFAATCTGNFSLHPQGAHTVVTWSMDGANNYVAKLMCLFMDQDKMIGPEFEKGLARLKALVEATPAQS